MILQRDEGICSSYSFWFYKKENKLSEVRHCAELDVCTLVSSHKKDRAREEKVKKSNEKQKSAKKRLF